MKQTPRSTRRLAGVVLPAALSALLVIGPAAAQDGSPVGAEEGLQDGLIAFEELPSASLLELYADVGLVLKQRGVVPSDWRPSQAYAERLAVKALGLGATQNGLAGGPENARYRVVGLRVADETTPVRLTGLGDATDFDELAVILFQQDFQVMAAAVFPQAVIAPKLEGGAVTLSKDVLTAPGVRSVTTRIYRHINDSF